MMDCSPPLQMILNELSKGVFSELIASEKMINARDAFFLPFPAYLNDDLVNGLKKNGISSLFSHQKFALDAIFDGNDVIISSGTASGKSLCYQIPIAQSLLRNTKSTALLLFPTKALAADQMKNLSQIFRNIDRLEDKTQQISQYDGDTKSHERIAIRNKSNILFSNPDMLHLSILPHHTRWEEYLGSLRYIVIDEVHTYRGVFGSHFSNVIRRLNRILAFYGANPQYILTSATISNAQSFCETLIERRLAVIEEDGSGHARKHFFFLNPPVMDSDLGIRKGMITQCGELVRNWVSRDIQMLLFARSRKTVELTLRRLRDHVDHHRHPVEGYRSGFLASERRQIESGLKNGAIQSVVATNALELGMDLGKVDVVIMMGYPGTVASFFQQSGRAGRRGQCSIAVLVASSSPIDQFIIRNADFIFEKKFEQALVDPDNPLILISHLQCAAYELPFSKEDSFGRLKWGEIKPYLTVLENTRRLIRQNQKFFWRSQEYPAAALSLRNISDSPIRLLSSTGKIRQIGELDFSSARRFVYPGAVYLHNGLSYKVVTLDLEEHEAVLEEFDGNYYTEPQLNLSITYQQTLQQRHNNDLIFNFGEVQVTEAFQGYKKLNWETNQLVDIVNSELPESTLPTKGFWLTIPETIVDSLRSANLWVNDPINYGNNWLAIRNEVLARDDFRCEICGFESHRNELHVHHKIPFRTFSDTILANNTENLVTLCAKCHTQVEQNVHIRSGLNGFAYLFAGLSPLFIMCDAQDIGYSYDTVSRQAGGGAVVTIYDQHPGGIGLSAKIYQLAEELIQQCDSIISSCVCKNGCPSCVGPSGENDVGGKRFAQALIQEINKMMMSHG